MNHRSDPRPEPVFLPVQSVPMLAPVIRSAGDERAGERDFRAAVRRLRATQRAPDDRTAGVLLWYSLSGALAADIVVHGRGFPTVGGAGLAVVQGAHGFIEEVCIGPLRHPAGPADPADPADPTDPADPPAVLGALLRDRIPRIAAASGARERVLWAIATDAVATAALRAAPRARPAEAAGTVDLLLRECRPEAPAARFEEVAGRGTVVVRGSCCLLYRCPAGSMCLSCPRQLPVDRRRRLTGGP